MLTSKKLDPTLGLFSATMLAISLVVGAGMLVLPGLVFKTVGQGAVWSWVGDTLLVIPLLWVFVHLGKHYPSAGGVAGFVAVQWPQAKVSMSCVLLGTFSLGIPAIALTGGQYILAGVGWPATPVLASMMALLLLGTAACIVLLGAKLASAWQNLVMVLLLAILMVFACATAPQWSEVRYTLAVEQLPCMWHGMALAFFSYTGWEMFASIAEEMQHPHRDFPRAVCISFVVIAVLYLSVALAIESTVARDDPTLATVPFLPVIANLTRNPVLATRALGSLVGVIIFTNLVGAVWAASRMVFDLGRGSAFGARLKLDRVHPASASPRHAVLFILGIFATVLAAHATGMLSISTMLQLAGQNFFLLYAICVAVFYKTVKTGREKWLAILTLALLCAFGTVFSAGLVYPLILFLLPYASRYCQSRRVQYNEATSQNNSEVAPRDCGNPERQDRWAFPRF